MSASHRILAVVSIGLLTLLLAGCSAVKDIVPEKITSAQATKVLQTAKALRSSFAEITDEEEYYIGRSVAALILSKYPVYQNEPLTRYVNLIGTAVAGFSSRPVTYAGYHFLILDSAEINALAAPGGFVFITKGLLTVCRDEEMLAAVLAHEVGHVAGKHGLQAIKQSRLLDVFKTLGSQAVAAYTPAQLSQLTDLFQGALTDIAGQLIEKGYDRKLEYEADAYSVKFTRATGYNPNGLDEFLQGLAKESAAQGVKGWFKTHPTPDQRLDKVRRQIAGLGSVPKKETIRTQRFKAVMAFLR